MCLLVWYSGQDLMNVVSYSNLLYKKTDDLKSSVHYTLFIIMVTEFAPIK